MKYRDPSTGNFRDLHVKVSDTLPIGTITQYGAATAPDGWLICDGSAVSRTTYSELFAAIGTTYGAGNGSTTFNLPDLRGRVGVGKSSDTEFDTIGETGGSKTHLHTTGNHTLTVDEIPSHRHSGTTDSAGAHTHNVQWTTSDGNDEWTLQLGAVGTHTNDHPIQSAGAHTHTFTTGYTGGGQAHNHGNTGSASTLQPYLVTNYIIKAYQVVAAPAKVSDLFPVGKVEIFFDNNDHSNYLGFTWERIAQGRTLVGIDSTNTYFDTIGKTGGERTHTLAVDEMPSHSHSGTTDSAGNHKHSLYFDRTSGSASGIKLDTNVNNVYTTSDYVTEAGAHTHTFTTGYTGGGQAFNVMDPYLVVAYWKRVS